MKRATVTIPDHLEKALDNYVRSQDAPPPLTAVVQAALREYLEQRGYVGKTGRFLRISPAGKGSGLSDISRNHDRYFAKE
ncbi:MAG: hypothetical protein JO166_17150 [Deltaproteobacteria bacterium]|nr:hypothetical protein [Deltaproteobacteria bacterium]